MKAVEQFDAANARDPNAKELLYAQRMTEWLGKLSADASEPLKLAVRCQHIRRWEIPRKSFPMDRAGYHKWRSTLYDFHADRAAEILLEVGYDDETIARVRSLLRKERLKADPEAQTLEDVACLVFLEFYFSEFAAQHDEAKVVNILKRTWAKMSTRGRQAAMTINLPPPQRELIAKALASGQQ